MNLAGGTVRIYAESDKLEPIASVFDPIVIPVNYVSFCGYDNLVRFYYDCNWEWTVHTAHCSLWHRSIFLISLNSLFNNLISIHLSKLYNTIQILIECGFLLLSYRFNATDIRGIRWHNVLAHELCIIIYWLCF